jgi:hypothetical protein
MANFSQSFTGKNILSPLPQADKSAQQGLNAMIVAAEELKYKTYKSNRDEFLKNAAIDPLFVLSDSARKTQMDLHSKFIKKWAKRAQETNYNFTDEDRQNMLTEKNFIIATAQDQVATMEKFKQHQELVQKNPGKFDPVKFAQDADVYMQTGRYDKTLPDWQPIDFGGYLQEESKKVTGKWNEKTIRDQYGQIQQETYNMPAEQEGKFIISQLGKNPQADADFWNRWGEADKEKYFKLADENKDNKTSPEEGKNAIALWAKDTFGSQARVRQLTTPKNPPTATNQETLGQFGKYEPTEAKATRLGQTDYKNYHTFNYLKAPDIPAGVKVRILNPAGEKEITPNETLSVDITGYDEDRDEFTFIVKSNFQGLYYDVNIPILEKGKDWRIAVKRTDLPPEFSNLKISKGGKRVAVGEIGTSVATPITPKKKRYNPETGRWEEV